MDVLVEEKTEALTIAWLLMGFLSRKILGMLNSLVDRHRKQRDG
jgi:hypothetical protein